MDRHHTVSIPPASIPQEPDIPVADFEGTLLHIYISSGHDYWGRQGEGRLQSGISEVPEVECVAGMGLRGDRYFGYRPDFKGQVTFLDVAVVDEIRQKFKLPKLPASVFRRNLIVRGANLKEWLGKRFRFQGIVFEGSQECKPCHWMDRAVSPGTEEFMKPVFRGGLRAKILTDGTLRAAS
ncbi:MAG: molybdenum cofactor biosysynthesis protein [Verrucomicrobiaceae bacterium]|nr:MAG: molybdenum cofactor biosysynthesis protein [Verrucomicrobiaceae bacterium]